MVPFCVDSHIYPFNCQFVVKRQQIKNHSNLGILGAMAHTLLIRCIPLPALGHVKSVGRGAYAHVAKKTFFTKGISVNVCTE